MKKLPAVSAGLRSVSIESTARSGCATSTDKRWEPARRGESGVEPPHSKGRYGRPSILINEDLHFAFLLRIRTGVTSLKRTFLSIVVGFAAGMVGMFLGAVFAPLVFPLSLHDPDRSPDLAVGAMLALSLLTGAGGFFLCWRLCRPYVRSGF